MSSDKSRRRKDDKSDKSKVNIKEKLADWQALKINSHCADCGARQPQWASWNLGVLVCIRCSGIHRNLGVHLSKVKSVTLDTWTLDQVELLVSRGGNLKVNDIYEANLPSTFRRPKSDQDATGYIQAKYERLTYCDKEALNKLKESEKKDQGEKKKKENGSSAKSSPSSSRSSPRGERKEKRDHRDRNKNRDGRESKSRENSRKQTDLKEKEQSKKSLEAERKSSLIDLDDDLNNKAAPKSGDEIMDDFFDKDSDNENAMNIENLDYIPGCTFAPELWV